MGDSDDQAAPSSEGAMAVNDAAAESSRTAPGAPQHPQGGGRSRKLLFAAAGVVGVALLAGGGMLAYGKLRGPTRTLPVLAQKLPPNTIRIFESRPGPALHDVGALPDIYVTSGLASLCDGVDLVALVSSSRGKDIDGLKKAGLLDLKAHRAGLQCGDALRRGLAAPAVTRILFRDGDTPRLVNVVHSRSTELPAGLGYIKHSFSGISGFCHHPEAAKDDCPPKTSAAARENETWFLGEFEDVEAFARSYTTAREELSTTVDILQQTIAATGAADSTTLVAKPEAIEWDAPCAEAAPVGKHKEFLAACFPRGQEKLLEGVTTKVRGLAFQKDVIARAEGVHMTYTLLARDADAARDIEKDLLDYLRDWRAQLTNGEPEMAKLVRAKSEYVVDSFWESIYEPYLRAIRGGHVTRSGNVVRLEIREALRPEEAKALREFTATRTSDRKAAGDIAEAVLAGAPPPEKALATFFSADVAKWMVAPRATDEDCATVQGKLKTLIGTADDASIKPILNEYKKSCVGGVMPPEHRQCLMGAADVDHFVRCRIPWSPYVVAAEGKLEGQWEADDFASSGYVDAQSRALLRKMRIEVKDGRVASSLGPTVSDGPAEVRSSGTDHARLVLTVMSKAVDVNVDWLTADTIKVKDFLPRVESITFKRAKFAESLFVQAKAAAARKAPGYDACLSGCMGRGGAVADCDKECIAP
jgi:hypothetical protein